MRKSQRLDSTLAALPQCDSTAPNKWKSFRLAVIINFTVDMQPRLLLIGREVLQNLHQIAHHLLTNSSNYSRTFRRNTDHYLPAALPRARAHDVSQIFQPPAQTARGSSRRPHLQRNA